MKSLKTQAMKNNQTNNGGPIIKLTKEVKAALLQALKVGYFDDNTQNVIGKFLFPYGEPIIIQVVEGEKPVEEIDTNKPE